MVTVISPAAAAAAAVGGSYGKALNRRCASGRRQQMAPEFITDYRRKQISGRIMNERSKRRRL